MSGGGESDRGSSTNEPIGVDALSIGQWVAL